MVAAPMGLSLAGKQERARDDSQRREGALQIFSPGICFVTNAAV